MRDLDFYIRYSQSILEDLGIEYNKNATYRISKRLTKSWGVCTKKVRRLTKEVVSCDIAICSELCEEDIDDFGLMNTLLHEMIHSCENCDDHTHLWRQYANMVNEKYHFNIQTCNSYEDYGLKTPPYRYKITCAHCGACGYYNRIPKFVKDTHRYSCECHSREWIIEDLRKGK